MEDGQTLETHLTSIWRQSGVIPDALDTLPVPYDLEHVWNWWLQLQETRPVGMQEGHITYTEMQNWSTLLKINVSPFEVRCIMAIDSAYIRTLNTQRAEKAQAEKARAARTK